MERQNLMAGRRKLLIVTVVWGDWYVGALTDLTLPALLAPQNLPLLAGHCDLEYLIVTRPAEVARIESSKAVQLARRFMTVTVFPALPPVIDASVNVFNFHHAVWSFAYETAKKADSYVFNLPPDSVFADGAGLTLSKLIGQGKKSITWVSPRVLDTVGPSLKSYATAEGPLVISPRDMVGLNLKHLHPLSKAYFADSTHFPMFHPEMVLWPAGDEGLVLRWFIGEGRLFNPNQVELSPQQVMTGKVNLDDFAVIDDSDDLYALALTSASHNADWYRSPDKADPARVGRWWLNFDGTSNDLMAARKVRIHAGERTPALWRAGEIRSDLFVSRATAAREFLRVAAHATALECSWTAALLTKTAETTACLRAFPRPMKAFVFGPTDEAVKDLSNDELLKPESSPRLMSLLRSHVALNERPDLTLPQQVAAAGGVLRLRSLAGRELTVTLTPDGREILVNGFKLVMRQAQAPGLTFIPVRGVLDPTFLPARSIDHTLEQLTRAWAARPVAAPRQDGGAKAKIKLMIVTVVWGAWHSDTFVNYALPSMLAPRNFPHMARHCDLELFVVTRPSDEGRIAAAASIQSARKYMAVNVIAALPERITDDPHEVHAEIWNWVDERARERDAFAFHLPPDSIYSDGTGVYFADRLAEGKKSILWDYPRAVDTMLAAMKDFMSAGGELVISARDLVAANLQHLDLYTKAFFADAPNFPVVHPEMVLWPVDDEGFVMRAFFAESRLFKPGYFQTTEHRFITGKLDPADVVFADDSDQFYTVALTPPGHWQEGYRDPARCDPVQVGVFWVQKYNATGNDFALQHQIRIHTGKRTEALWRAQEFRANRFACHAAATQSAYRLAAVVLASGCRWTAGLIMSLLQHKLLLRTFTRPDRLIIFAPTDQAAQVLGVGLVTDPARAKELPVFARRHVAIDPDPARPLMDRVQAARGMLQLQSLSGDPLVVKRAPDGSLTVNGARFARLPVSYDGYTVIPIEAVLNQALAAAS